jgi:hypothetical protein
MINIYKNNLPLLPCRANVRRDDRPQISRSAGFVAAANFDFLPFRLVFAGVSRPRLRDSAN